MSPRILFVQQEWAQEFHRSTQWSYISSLGYIEALRNCGADVTLLTTPWFPFARELLADQTFDQIWMIDLVHLEMAPGFFSWLEDLAPCRVGLIGESLGYTASELCDAPKLSDREDFVRARAEQMTHLLFVDEADARHYNADGKSSLWLPPGMLRSLIVDEAAIAPSGPVGFIGELYPKRQRFFAEPCLAGRIAHIRPNDRTVGVEAEYLRLGELVEHADSGTESRPELFRIYHQGLMRIRREIFERYLSAFGRMGATLNPPSYVKCYPGRVFEAIARGIPVITCRLKDRPGADRLFIEGREVLLFSEDDPESLCARIEELDRQPETRKALAIRAHRRLLADHTLEGRCELALRFIEETS